jgi:hypothetical protein
MSEKNWEPVEIEDCKCERLSASGKAVLITRDGGSDYQAEWIPCALIRDESEAYKPGTDGVLVIPQWLAEEKGFV